MRRFSKNLCVANSGANAREYVIEKLSSASRVLFIGTVGLDSASLFYPHLLAKSKNVDFRFIVEQRPSVSSNLIELGLKHREHLVDLIGASRAIFSDIEVVAADGATVAGRNAVRVAARWLEGEYTDIVVDTTGMSRGTCFPIVHQAMQMAISAGINMHVLIAANEKRSMTIRSESNDRADWMHGFQGLMGTDRFNDALKLWVPQLAEGTSAALGIMYGELQPVAEVCPIVPFPAIDPLRGDRLLLEHNRALKDQWESGPLDVIYAHESDPLDVFRTISTMHSARQKVFGKDLREAVTILSPSGWRIGSVGMLLAAIEHDLPMLYVETVGYTSADPLPLQIKATTPDFLWHLWLAGEPYDNSTSS